MENRGAPEYSGVTEARLGGIAPRSYNSLTLFSRRSVDEFIYFSISLCISHENARRLDRHQAGICFRGKFNYFCVINAAYRLLPMAGKLRLHNELQSSYEREGHRRS